jgi:hypothetical protein
MKLYILLDNENWSSATFYTERVSARKALKKIKTEVLSSTEHPASILSDTKDCFSIYYNTVGFGSRWSIIVRKFS